MIIGKAGTGKTKLSLELIKRFKKENSGYDLKIISNNGSLDIWDDLRIQLITDRKYIIVLDDANRLKVNLEQILTFIKNRNDDGKIKLIITVRNYVKSEVEKYIEHFELLELKPFTESELAKILQSPEFNISDYYVNRIFSISKGNPRIAIMAAIAGINNDIEKLNNASEIYELYFYSVKKNIDSFDNLDLLKTAGILSLFRVIDFGHLSTINEIHKYFNLKKEILIENLRVLYKLEIVDEYGEAYKIVDQILGEYIFYSVFIKGKKFPFYELLKIYIEKRTFPLTKILNPIVSNYGFESVKSFIISDLKKAWKEITNHSIALQYIEDFWYYLPTETLTYLHKFGRPTDKINTSSYLFQVYEENRINSFDDKKIEILLHFSEFPSEFNTSLHILNDYCLTNQVGFSKFLKALKESFTYSRYSYEEKYRIQREVFEYLFLKVDEDEDLYSKIIIFIAPFYLVDHYNSNSLQGNQFKMETKWICLIDEQKKFRTKIWEFIYEKYNDIRYRDFIQITINNYIDNLSYHFNNDDVIIFDKDFILDIIEDHFKPDDFLENVIVEKYTSKLDILGVSYNHEINSKHQSDKFKTYLTFQEEKLKRKDFNGDWKEYEKYKEAEILKFVDKYGEDDYIKLIKDLECIYSYNDQAFKGYLSLNPGIETILNDLEKKEFSLFLFVLENILKSKFGDQIALGRVLYKITYTHEKINSLRNLLKDNFYLISFLWNGIPANEMIDEDYKLLQEAIQNYDITNFRSISLYLSKMNYCMVNEAKEMNHIIDVLFSRVKNEKIILSIDFFLLLQNQYSIIYQERFEDIKKAYLILDFEEKYFDYNLDGLSNILSSDPNYIKVILEHNFDDKLFVSKRDLSNNDYRKLWELNNYKEVMPHFLSYFKKFHRHNRSLEISSLFQENHHKGIEVLKSYLNQNKDEDDLILVYNIVVSEFNERRFEFLRIILDINDKIQLFKNLDFYLLSGVYSGSRIPRLRHAINECERVINFLRSLNDLKYLEHVIFLEDRIIYKNSDIEAELKHEFIRDWGI